MWDVRAKEPMRTFSENTDFIGDMALHKGKLLCAWYLSYPILSYLNSHSQS